MKLALALCDIVYLNLTHKFFFHLIDMCIVTLLRDFSCVNFKAAYGSLIMVTESAFKGKRVRDRGIMKNSTI